MEISDKKKKFIRKNYPRMSEAELAKQLNIKKKDVRAVINELSLDSISVVDKGEVKEWAIFSEGKGKSKIWKTGGIAFFLIVVLFIFFWKVIFSGQYLSSADALFSYYPWKAVAPEGFTRPANYLLWDEFFGFYPIYTFISDALKEGIIPLWEPYRMCGIPNEYFIISSILFPANALFYFFSPQVFPSIRVILVLFIAGISFYLFSRSLLESSFGSLVSAIVFMFSAFMVTVLFNPVSNIAALLPLLFFLTEKYLQNRSFAWFSVLSLTIGIQYFGFHLPTSFHILLVLGIYFIFRVVVEYRNNRNRNQLIKAILFFLLANIAGLVLASIQILPFLEMIQNSSELTARVGGSMKYKFLSLRSLILFLIPNFYGNPVDGNTWDNLLKLENFYEQCVYIGIFPLLLTALAVIFRRRNSTVIFFSVLGIVTLVMVYGVPGIFHLMANLPGFNLITNTRLRLISTLSFSVLAGMGANFLVYKMDEERKKRILKFIFSPITIIIFLVSIFLIFQYRYFLGKELYNTLVNHNISSYIFRYSVLFLILLVSSAGIIILYCKNIIKLKIAQLLIISVIIVDVFIFGIRWYPTNEKKDIYPMTDSINFLKQDKEIFRIAALGNTLIGNSSVAYKLFDIRGHSTSNLQRYEEFITRSCCVRVFFYFMSNIHPHSDLMNVKYLLFPPNANFPESERFSKVFDKDLKIYRNNNYYPRAFIVHRAEVIKDDKLILNRLYDPNFDPRHFIVLEKDVSEELQKLNDVPLEDNSSAEIIKYENNQVLINTKMENPGFLFLSDTFYPNWKAYVNGEEREILRADYTFRAVFLEEGEHTIEFKYDPKALKIGLYLSSIMTIVLLGILIWSGILEKTWKVKSRVNG